MCSRFMDLFLGLNSVSLAHMSDFVLEPCYSGYYILVLFYYVSCCFETRSHVPQTLYSYGWL